MEKRNKTALESGVLIVVIGGILIALNALSALGGYRRIDTTKTAKYTLSDGSGRLLRSMKQDMMVDAYVTKGLPKLDAFVRDLRDLLVEYKTAGGGRFDFQLVEAKDDDTKKKAKEAGLVEQPFGEASDTEEKAAVTQGFMGLVFRYGEQQDKIAFLPPDRTDGLEFWITNKIREVRDTGDGIKHTVGILTGHEEIKLSETNLVPSNMGKYSMDGIIRQNFRFYQFEDVDLKGGESDINEKLDGLIITQPTKDLTEKELRRIDQFVMRGKSLAIYASSVNVKNSDASMNATLGAHGLEKLLEGYGIELRKDVVLDYGRAFHVNLMTNTGVARQWFPHFLSAEDDSRFTGDEQLLDTSFPPFFRIPTLVFPLASSVVLHKEKQPGASLRVVARSTPASFRVTTDTVDLRPIQRWTPPKGSEPSQFAIAATVEGEKLKSAFPSGDKQGVDAPAESVGKARVFVIASSQFLANPLARAGNGPDMGQMGMMMPGMGGDEQLQQLAGPYAQQAITQTILSFKNALDWLSGDTDLLAVSAKILSEPSLAYGDVTKPKFDPNESEDQLRKRDQELKESRKAMQSRVQWLLILGIPMLFAGYGILRWRLRLMARANISLA